MKNLFSAIAQGAKDVALSELGRILINRFHLERYGTMEHLRIDTTEREIHFDLLLKGEEKPIAGTLRYRLEEADGDLVLVADAVTVSREWMNVLIDERFTSDRRRFVLPAKVRPIIERLL